MSSPVGPYPAASPSRLMHGAPIGSYLLSEKIGQPLHELHSQIPHFHKMLASVERTMVRFAPDRPFERCSWWVADDRELFWRAFPFSLALVFVLIGRACDR